ncbi:MAG: T9SS type A sorting domain-containing protein [Saprospiraceae bacterium]
MKGNLCFLSYYHDGVVVYDISNPTDVTLHAYYDTETTNTNYSGYQGAWGVYPFLPSGKIIASDVLNGLFVLELTGALPVSWQYFHAKPSQKGIALEWATEQETHNKGFHVQRKSGKNEWHTIGFVAATSTRQYELTDEAPLPGWNTYRLEQEDVDGTRHYSTFATTFWEYTAADWKIYPNPVVGNTLFLAPPLHDNLPVTIQLYHSTGIKMYEATSTTNGIISIDTQALPHGIYYYTIHQEGQTTSGQIVIPR